MIYLRADGHKATITKDLPITTGSVGLQVEVSLSEDFDGLASVVTFRAGTVVADVAYVGELVEVPPQVMTKPNTALLIGVYAQSADGRTVIPTVWDNAGIIQPGTLPDDFPQPDPAPSWAAQVQLWAQEAHETAEALAEDVSEWGVAEEGRVAAEQSRVTAESARAQSESSRASAETARVNAETARAQAEAEREDAESIRSSLEALRVQAESEREGAESARVEAESSRATAESARASAEAARVNAESSRASAESQRAAAETARVNAEQVRATAEEARVLAEQGRASAETVRADAEQARQSAETARSQAEGARVQTESQRAENEALRVSAEASRASAWATMQQEIESATEGAESVDATVTKSGSTATISVTDRTGTTHTATVSDGTDGTSPTASVQRVEGGAEVTVTDASGTTTAMLYDATIAEGSITDAMLAPDGIKAQVASMWGNRLTGELSGTVLTASDAYAAPPLEVEVDGKSEQDGTPTPDAPVEISSVVDPVVTFAGRNLFDKSDITPNRYINASGGLSAWNAASASDYIPVVPNTSYTLHFGASPGNNRIAFYSQADIDEFISPTVSFSSTSVTFTTPDGARFVRFSCYTSVLDSAQLEAGSTATAYTPYVTPTTVTLPVTLRSLPDGTRDTATYTYLRPSSREGWAWYAGEVTRVTGKVTYDGTENWRGSGSWYGYYITAPNDAAASAPANALLNTHGVGTAYSSAGMASALGATALGSSFISYNWDNAPGSGRITPFKEWLAENNMTVMYPLATPVTTTLEPIELPSIVGPSCTIYATADATPELQVTYERDVNITIAALEAAIADIATS